MRCTSFRAVASTSLVPLSCINLSIELIHVKEFVRSERRFSVGGERFISHPGYPQPHLEDLKLGQYLIFRAVYKNGCPEWECTYLAVVVWGVRKTVSSVRPGRGSRRRCAHGAQALRG